MREISLIGDAKTFNVEGNIIILTKKEIDEDILELADEIIKCNNYEQIKELKRKFNHVISWYEPFLEETNA